MKKKAPFILIPDAILLDKRLSPTSQIFFGIVHRMTRLKGHCWATNAAFCDLLNRDERSIRRCLRELEDGGYISIENRDNKTRKIYSIQIEDLPNVSIFSDNNDLPTRTKLVRNPDKTVVVDESTRTNQSENPDINVPRNIISNKINSTSSTTSNPDTNVPQTKMSASTQISPLSGTQQVLALRPSGYWEGKRHDFLQNQIFLEKFSIAKRIPAAATAALMEHFCTDLELRNDHITSADRLQNHFTHWFNLGITKGYVLQDGTLKNQPPANPQPSNEHQQPIRPWSREISGDDILLKYGNDRERAQAAAGG